MSYTDQESPFTWRRVAAAFGGIAVVAIVGLAIRASSTEDSASFLDPLFDRTLTAAEVETELERVPEMRGMIAAFKAHYRSDYDQLLQRIAATANARGQAAAGREAHIFMARFVQSKVQHIARAPSSDLHALGEAIVEFSEALRAADLPLCAQVQMTGFRPEDRPPSEVMPSLARLNVAQLRAARLGEDGKGVARGPIGDADAIAWMNRLRAIDARTAELLATNRLEQATPQEQCDGGISIYRAALDLPAEQSANVLGGLLMASSTAEPGA